MKLYTANDFIEMIRKDIQPLSFEDFCKTKQLSRLWAKLKPNDIRIKLLKNKKNFYKWCYDFIHNDIPLKLYFQQRLSYVGDPLPSSLGLKAERLSKNLETRLKSENMIQHVSDNSRYIKNINLPSLMECKNYRGENIKNIYKKALEEGIMSSCFVMPSVFKDSYIKNYDTFVVTLKTYSGQMSIFSPVIYQLLLRRTDNYFYRKKIKQKILIPSASWGTPVLSTLSESEYEVIHIVDVQNDVLKLCENIHMCFHEVPRFGQKSDLKTFCIPSEKMTQVIDDDYDKIFFCPPYYDLELYGGSDEQSTTLYTTYKDWLDLYWRKTVYECDKVLKKGGLFCFVMGLECRKHKIGFDMKTIAEEKFTLKDEIKILPPIEPTRDSNKIEKYEICYIMRKETK